ncbi:MAG: RNA-guided endonuclease TnpB family protein [Candidatus Thorarchaeota archaeon]|nr:RNA-guided endonuclease TnpB family protein [Candidatus Thorarchaeota archaeon]
MLVHKAYRYELDPANSQRTLLHQHAGVARFVYNWGLDQRISLFKNNQGKDRFTDAMKQHKLLNSLKKIQFPWMYETSKCAPQESLRDLHKAFQNFYRGLKQGKMVGFPKFKRKGVRDSFRLTGTIRFEGRKLQLPRIGKIRIKEKRKRYYNGRILSVTIRRRANRWFVSITVEEGIPDPTPVRGKTVGVDLGVKTLATLSDGTIFENPRALGKQLKKLKHLSRSLSRKEKGSRNREKAKTRLARMYLRVFNIRQDTLHKVTTYLAKSHSKVVIEDLGVSGMMKNRRLSLAIADVGFYEFRRQLEYKCQWYGSQLIVASRTFPSSKRCSNCGHKKKELSLSERDYHCEECGLRIDRDLNAALNLVTVSLPETQTACGEDVRLIANPLGFTDKQTSVKQEPNINPRH